MWNANQCLVVEQALDVHISHLNSTIVQFDFDEFGQHYASSLDGRITLASLGSKLAQKVEAQASLDQFLAP